MSKHIPVYKIVIIGDSGVGKSSLLKRFANDEYCDSSAPTIGVDFQHKLIDASSTVKLQVWDTAGQERFRCVTAAYYRGADCIIIMYDITNRESFEKINYWIKQSFNASGDRRIVTILVGSKCDGDRKITTEEGIKLSKENNMLFFEVSSKTAENVSNLFICAANNLLKISGHEPSNIVDPVEKENHQKKGFFSKCF